MGAYLSIEVVRPVLGRTVKPDPGPFKASVYDVPAAQKDHSWIL